MPNKIKKLLVLTSGGDAPGMNAAIRAVVRSALYNKIEVYGTEMGYTGLLNKEIFPLHTYSVGNIIQHGGTILKTGRATEFRNLLNRDACREFLAKEKIDAMIILGGDGSFTGAALLHNEGGPNVIGIPCTIDNDIVGTDYCIGFDTACNTAMEAIDKIRDTAFSHNRNFMIEVMGRASGFLAVEVGIATGAEIILIPEFPLNAKQLVEKIESRSRKKMLSLAVVAEANQPGRSYAIAEEIKQLSGIEYRVSVLGYIQRGGAPTIKDRTLASHMGVTAVEALLAGHTQKMTAIQKGEIVLAPFPDPQNATRYFTNQKLLQENEILCAI